MLHVIESTSFSLKLNRATKAQAKVKPGQLKQTFYFVIPVAETNMNSYLKPNHVL